MPITAGVGTATNSSGGTNALAVTRTGCTAGRQLRIGCLWESATATINSITIGGESNATLIGSKQAVGDVENSQLQLAYLPSLSSSGDKTITLNLSASAPCAIIVEEVQGGDTGAFYTGVEAAGALNETDDGNITFSITTPNANDSVFGVGVFPGSALPSAAGFTALSMAQVFRINEAYRILDAGAAGAKTFNGTVNAFAFWGWKFAAFKAAGGGGGGAQDYPLETTLYV